MLKWTLYFYVCSFIFYSIRLNRFLSRDSYLGPKVVMVTNMMRDMGYFLIILLGQSTKRLKIEFNKVQMSIIVYMLPYGLAVQALIYPGFYAPIRSFIWAVIFQPFMEVLGDPRLDEIGASNEDICDDDSNAPWPYVTCPNVKNTFFALALKLFYMIFTNTLLLNLLIAIFNNRYEQVNEKSKLYWKCGLFSIMQDYYDRQKLHFFCFFCVEVAQFRLFF